MSECDLLVDVVLSLTEVLQATGSKPLLNQLVGMAVLEASECLVRTGFAATRLTELGVGDDLAYFMDAKYRACRAENGDAGASRGPHLRLVGA